MRKDVLLMLLGTLVAFLPFLGLPNSWDNILMVIMGISIIGVAIAVRRAKKPPSYPQLFSERSSKS